MFPNLQRDDGPFLASIGPFLSQANSVGVAVAVPALTNATDGTPTDEGTEDATVDTTVGNGTLYWAVLPEDGTATAQQVKYGGGSVIVHGSQAVVGTGTQTVLEITGLEAETIYALVFLQTNSLGSDSAQAEVELETTA